MIREFDINLVQIREMTEFDIAPIVKLEKEIFSDSWPDEVFNEILEDDTAYSFIAEIDSVVAGYAIYLIEFGEAHLANIAIDPSFRGKNIAKKLLNRILEAVKKADCENIYLDVRLSNKPAIDLYIKFGFIELCIKEKYYSSPVEDALVMVKNLREEVG